jgi:arogenate dehydrogenase (NADP+)
VLCTHPMFGSDSGKDGWKDLNFMYERVRIRDEDTCSSFLQIFESEVTFSNDTAVKGYMQVKLIQ